jgi:hypothetical protein
MFLVDEIQKIPAQLLFVDLIRGFPVMPGQLAHRQ